MTCPIQNCLEKVTSYSLRVWGVVFAAICSAVIASVFISQYGFGLQPCELCLYQRMPFYAGLGVSLLLVIFGSKKRIGFALLGVLAICFAISAALGLFHLGVEYKWWTYNSGCTAGIFGKGSSTADILAALKNAAVVKCDERVEFLFGMTMAFYNVLVSAGLFVATIIIGAYKCKSSCGTSTTSCCCACK